LLTWMLLVLACCSTWPAPGIVVEPCADGTLVIGDMPVDKCVEAETSVLKSAAAGPVDATRE